jgi:hypothetical protein
MRAAPWALLVRSVLVASLLASSLLVASLPAAAARPLTTDNASVLEAQRCQVEAWWDRSHESSQAWLVPACDFGGGIEWQLGMARMRAQGDSRFSAAYLQAKTLLWSSDASPWAVGIVAGLARRPTNERYRGFDNPYLTVPVSLAVGSALVHVNAGWNRDREARRDLATWGIAGELPVAPRVTAVAETFGRNRERPFLRAGGRVSVVRDSIDLDLTLVTRPGGTRDERFVSLGVFWQSGRFLP